MRVKVCGITNVDDALLAVEYGAWALGFNFFSGSPRYIAPETVQSICRFIPSNVIKIGIFVNMPVERILSIQQRCELHILQLHGEEKPKHCQLGKPVIKALRLKSDQELPIMDEYRGLYSFLIDHYSQNVFGGSGQCADWQLAKLAARKFPTILAGGLNVRNIQEAIETVQPIAVDVCSGIEETVGKKSRIKMRDFFKAVRGEI